MHLGIRESRKVLSADGVVGGSLAPMNPRTFDPIFQKIKAVSILCRSIIIETCSPGEALSGRSGTFRVDNGFLTTGRGYGRERGHFRNTKDGPVIKEQWEIAWKDYYRVLQVDERAEAEVIEGAYRKLAQKYHPDRTGNTDPERIKLINEAHEILGDPDRRRAYDRVYRVRKGRTAPTPPQPTVFQHASQELFEKAEEARKLAREVDEKAIAAHSEVESARQAFREAEKRMEEARAAAMLARKTLATLEGQATAARQEVTEARKSVREAEKTEKETWKEAKDVWKKAGEAQTKERDAWKALEEARKQALDADRGLIEAMRWTGDVRRKAAQIQESLKDARIQKELRQAEKKEAEARNRLDKTRQKASFLEEKQIKALETAKEWARKLEEAERVKSEAQLTAEAARQRVTDAEKRAAEARRAVEDARRRVADAETREGETRQSVEEFRRKTDEAEKKEREARHALDAARRRAEDASRKVDEARQKAMEARKKAQDARDRMDEAKEREASPSPSASVFNPASAEEDEREVRAQRLHLLPVRFHETVTFGLGLLNVGADSGGFWTGRTEAGRSRIDHGAYEVRNQADYWQATWAGLRRLRSDFIVTLRTTKAEGAGGQGYGLVFRSAGSGNNVPAQTWHFFSLWPRGEAAYHRLTGPKGRALADLAAKPCPSLRPGDAPNELRIVWRKDRAHFFVNAAYVVTLTGLPDEDLQMGGLVLGGGRIRFTGLDLLCAIPPRRKRLFFRTVQWGHIETAPDDGSAAS
jgi:curved DNA-binding protein CbpA